MLRFKEHDVGTPDLEGYTPRTDELRDEMREREPVKLATERVLSDGLLDQQQIDAIHQGAQDEVAAAERFADESPIAQPSEQELLAAVYAP